MSIKRCKESFSVWVDGAPRVVTAGQLIDENDPLYSTHAHLFEAVETYVSDRRPAGVEDASAAPGALRTVTAPQEAGPFDPGAHNAAAVLAHLAAAGEAEALRVLDAEAAGQERRTILKNREAILETARANDAAAEPAADQGDAADQPAPGDAPAADA